MSPITDMEYFEKASSKCRVCNHMRFLHTAKMHSECIEYDVLKTGKLIPCTCKKFIPLDNLEYLEWKYENKIEEKD